MRPAERRVADFVLHFPGDLASYSATEVAKFANVSNATVSRFYAEAGVFELRRGSRDVRNERSIGAALFMLDLMRRPPKKHW